MDWKLIPALLGAAVMAVFGLGAALRPAVLKWVGVSADSALGRSEIRAVFGGMFVAFGVACIVLRDPIVFAVVGLAWLGDAVVRAVSAVVDRVPPRDAAAVLGTALVMAAAIGSGYWLA